MKLLVVFILKCYKRFLSPFLPPACRFTPTCSEYAIEAFEKKRMLKAAWISLVRFVKCNPFHPGGYDPVQLFPEDSWKHED